MVNLAEHGVVHNDSDIRHVGEVYSAEDLMYDKLTGLLTPFGEKITLGGKSITGRIFVDWNDMHSAMNRFGDERVALELARTAAFLQSVYQCPNNSTVVTYISGDNFTVSSTGYTEDELLNTLFAQRENFASIAQLVCGRGFPDKISQDVHNYWSQFPERRFQLVFPSDEQNVAALDIRHLKATTEKLGVPGVEDEIYQLKQFLRRRLSSAQVVERTRTDEIWAFFPHPVSRIVDEMETITDDYQGNLAFDWGVGSTVSASHKDLQMRKEKSSIVRIPKGDFVLSVGK